MIRNITIVFAVGAAALALLLIYSLVRAVRAQRGLTWLQIVLGGIGICTLFVGMILLHLNLPQEFTLQAVRGSVASARLAELLWIVPIVCAAGCAVIIVVEFFKRKTSGALWGQSSGIFTLLLGGLVALALFFAPRLAPLIQTASLIPATQTSTPIELASVPTSVPVLPMLPTNTPLPALTNPLTTPNWFTPLPTQYIPTTPTSTPMPNATAAAARCSGVIQNNLNLRTGPGVNYDRMTTISAGTTVAITAQNTTGDWYRVLINSESGWMSADYLQLSAACGQLPVEDAP